MLPISSLYIYLKKIDPQSIVNDEELLLLSLDRLKPSTSATETEIETKNKGLLLEAIENARTVSKLPFEHTLFDEPLEDKKLNFSHRLLEKCRTISWMKLIFNLL